MFRCCDCAAEFSDLPGVYDCSDVPGIYERIDEKRILSWMECALEALRTSPAIEHVTPAGHDDETQMALDYAEKIIEKARLWRAADYVNQQKRS